MESIAVGKLLPNLKVTVGNQETPDEKSDGQNSDVDSVNSDDQDSDQKVEIVRSWMHSLQSPKIYRNKGGAFTTGLDLVSEVNSGKLDKRAERFGIEESLSSPESISSLYKSMGIEIENKNSAKNKNIRLDALHVRGINELNTSDVFKYFHDYGPASMEWINDFSCNVVWMDESTCARALLGLSKPLKNSTSKEESKVSDGEEPMEGISDENTANSETKDDKFLTETEAVEKDKESSSEDEDMKLEIPVPPGCWRLGVPHPKAKNILLRFATKDDKKVRGAEKRSEFYKKYGNPNYGGLRGLISGSRKRKMLSVSNRQAIEGESGHLSEESSQKDDIPLTKPKLPRMRMYADDEEHKSRISRYNEIEKQGVHSRLGRKYTKEDLCNIGIYNSDFNRSSSLERDEYQPRDLRERTSTQSDRFRVRDLREKTSSQSNRFLSRDLGDKSSFQSDRHRSRDFKDRSYGQSDRFRSRNFESREERTHPERRDSSPHNQLDLRKKITKLKTDVDVTKHRSPLCMDD